MMIQRQSTPVINVNHSLGSFPLNQDGQEETYDVAVAVVEARGS